MSVVFQFNLALSSHCFLRQETSLHIVSLPQVDRIVPAKILHKVTVQLTGSGGGVGGLILPVASCY